MVRLGKFMVLVVGVVLAGCRYENVSFDELKQFTCSRADLDDLRDLVESIDEKPGYTFHVSSTGYTNQAPAAYRAAVELNEHLAESCPAPVLKACAPLVKVNELREDYSHRETTGPINAFGVEITYQFVDMERKVSFTHDVSLRDEKKFEEAFDCFKSQLN